MEREAIRLKRAGSIVLDSSVVMKWFRKSEALREQALQLRQAYLDGSLALYVPDLLIYEIANVLRYKPDMNPTKVQQALHSLFEMGIRIERITPEVIGRAIAIAYSYDVTVYDAAFVALAENVGAALITADQKLSGSFRISLLSSISLTSPPEHFIPL